MCLCVFVVKTCNLFAYNSCTLIYFFPRSCTPGESQYNKRLEDIRLLKIEIANLRSQRNLLTRGLANTADMRQEVLQLHRVLTQERVKAKALEEEMTTPMNIHRFVFVTIFLVY